MGAYPACPQVLIRPSQASTIRPERVEGPALSLPKGACLPKGLKIRRPICRNWPRYLVMVGFLSNRSFFLHQRHLRAPSHPPQKAGISTAPHDSPRWHGPPTYSAASEVRLPSELGGASQKRHQSAKVEVRATT